MSALIVIPARMKATRLPNKPLADIAGVPMIVQVWRRAMEAGVGDVVVACDGEEIAQAVRAAGGVAVVTDPDLPSGSDRVWAAVTQVEARGQRPEARGQRPEDREEDSSIHEHAKDSRVHPPLASGLWPLASTCDIIINLQGDLPTFEPHLLRDLLVPLQNPAVDIATLVAEITREEEHENPSVVKAVLSFDAGGATRSRSLLAEEPNPSSDLVGGFLSEITPPGCARAHPAHPTLALKTARALYFTRLPAPYGDGPRYHHIGVYAYRRAALERFVSLPPSSLEQREKLEQLRALEAGMRIDVCVVDTIPLGVDTPEDLARARAILESRKG